MKTPESLVKGDKIAIISPATAVRREYVEGAAEFLKKKGFEVEIYSHALGPSDGNYASSRLERREDFFRAMKDPEVKCILCARGGYGCCHLLDLITPEEIEADPKWIIGFSDVSALHSLMLSAGIRSLHAPMAKHLTLLPEDSATTGTLLDIITGKSEISYSWISSPLSHPGVAKGEIKGGNLAVINGLANTPFDMFSPRKANGAILFIEDIAEPIYKIDRVLNRLHLAGTLKVISGLIIGQFTEYHSDSKFETVGELIATRLNEWGYEFPVAYNAPIGHVDDNRPVVEGADAILTVDKEKTTLEMKF